MENLAQQRDRGAVSFLSPWFGILNDRKKEAPARKSAGAFLHKERTNL
jgi:hypothetical protein